MKALTIKQPWAGLIMGGRKDVENRSWRTDFRGRFAVHVALRPAKESDLGLDAMTVRHRKPIREGWLANADAGRVIGTVELLDCVEGANSPWAIDGYWHWLLADPRPYTRPVPALGRLNLWNWHR